MAQSAGLKQKEREAEAAQIAREQVASGMWNLNLMMAFYAVLAATLILAFRGVAIEIVAAVAFTGLLLIWLFARVRYKKLYKHVFQSELLHLQDLSREEQSKTSAGMDVPPSSGEVGATLASSPLTLRQKEILSYIASGYSNKQIAAHLNLSEQTVKNQIRSVFKKLGVEDRTQAVLMAIRRGWVSPAFPERSPRDTEQDLKK